MEKASFVDLSGTYFAEDERIFTVANRSFRYGDGVFESIRIINGKTHLLELHIQRLFNAARFLKIELPEEWNYEFFQDAILRLADKNGVAENGRLRLSIFRQQGGLYSPKRNGGEYVLEARGHDVQGFPLNEEGLRVDIYTEIEKTTNHYSNFKTSNSLVYVMASLYRKEHNLDDCFIINSKSRVIEAISANIFFIRDGKIYTPPLSEGCISGIMRTHLLQLMEKEGMQVQETPLTLEELFQADELFLTNTIQGIRWVKNYKIHEYKLKVAKKLAKMLNKAI
ncbi:MAG: aminotransferase class IV [Bacteroidia bacterium]